MASASAPLAAARSVTAQSDSPSLKSPLLIRFAFVWPDPPTPACPDEPPTLALPAAPAGLASPASTLPASTTMLLDPDAPPELELGSCTHRSERQLRVPLQVLFG